MGIALADGCSGGEARLNAGGPRSELTMKSLSLPVVLALLTPLSAGCASIVNGTHQTVRLTSLPEGAGVAVDDRPTNRTTPAYVRLARNSDYTLTVSMAGYMPQEVTIEHRLQAEFVVIDLLLGLVPLIIDASTGGWYELLPGRAKVTLTKTSAAPGPSAVQAPLGP